MTTATATAEASSRLAFAIRRVEGAVVMQVRGVVDPQGSGTLQQIISDLVEGQGNGRVLVDLTTAEIPQVDALAMFCLPVEQARRRRTEFAVLLPPSTTRAEDGGGRA